MDFGLLPVVFLAVVILAVAIAGVLVMLSVGFFRTALGALGLSIVLSLLLSALANVLLTSVFAPSGVLGGESLLVSNGRAFTAALAQPTLTGMALLGVVLLLCVGAAQIINITEELQILLDSHVSVLQSTTQKAS